MRINPIPELFISRDIDNSLAEYVKNLNCMRAFVITGPNVCQTEGFSKLITTLYHGGIEVSVYKNRSGDPTFYQVDKIVEDAREFEPDIFIGIGGGSPLDAAKVVSSIINKDEKAKDLTLKAVNISREYPLILVPTTSGSGSEITPISILTDYDTGIKTTITHKELIPDAAFLYSEMTNSMPRDVVASTGMDALCHAIEAYLSKKSNSFSNIMVREALNLIKDNLVESFIDINNRDARRNMMLASLYAGVAFSNSTVAAIHAFSYPLGGTYNIPHGIANSVMLIPILKHNLVGNEDKLSELSEFLGLEKSSLALIEYIKKLIYRLELPKNLYEAEVPQDGLEDLASKVLNITRLLEVNPNMISQEDAIRIYKEAFNGEEF